MVGRGVAEKTAATSLCFRPEKRFLTEGVVSQAPMIFWGENQGIARLLSLILMGTWCWSARNQCRNSGCEPEGYENCKKTVVRPFIVPWRQWANGCSWLSAVSLFSEGEGA